MARIVIAFLLLCSTVHARDLGQWEATDPEIRQWYQALNQPDAPVASCCGEADAYWCDQIFSRTEKERDSSALVVHNYCKITDDRPDAPLRRRHIDIGTEVLIPSDKMKWNPSDPQPRMTNPTGHAIVFLSTGMYVYCFVDNGGV